MQQMTQGDRQYSYIYRQTSECSRLIDHHCGFPMYPDL